MNLTPHTAPKMDRAPRYRHKVASFRKNSMERLDIVIEEYNGLDLLNLSVTRDSSGTAFPQEDAEDGSLHQPAGQATAPTDRGA